MRTSGNYIMQAHLPTYRFAYTHDPIGHTYTHIKKQSSLQITHCQDDRTQHKKIRISIHGTRNKISKAQYIRK